MKDAITPTFTVEKSTVELYKIRSNDFAWADITIDAHGRAGRISVASDYGNWQNYWGACGSDFKTFLSQISESYAATKFSAEERIDVDGTIKLWKELLISYRRDETLDAEKARSIYDEIEEVASEDRQGLLRAFDNTSDLSPFMYDVCGAPELVHEPCPHFKRFWKELWPALLAEFAREKSAAAATPIQEGRESQG